MYIKSSSLLMLAFAFSVRGIAQTTFSSGYIVRSGDTLRGNLKVDRQKDLMTGVNFKKGDGTDFVRYTPSELSSFQYDGGALYRTISFVNTANPNPVAETVFAQTLVSGVYSLYRVDVDGGTDYVVTRDTATYFLYDDKISGSDFVHGNYRSFLLLFSSGCEGLDQSRASYSDKSLTGFMQGVNRCQAPGVASSSFTVKPHSEVHYFVFAGGFGAGYDHQITADAQVRFVTPRIDPKASLNIGLRYSNTGTHTEATSYDYIYRIEHIWVSKQTHEMFSVPVTFQYNFLRGRIQPAVYAGFSAAYLSESPSGSSQKFGAAIIGGACIEAYITSHFLLKTDWRYEWLAQWPSFGVGFKF